MQQVGLFWNVKRLIDPINTRGTIPYMILTYGIIAMLYNMLNII